MTIDEAKEKIREHTGTIYHASEPRTYHVYPRDGREPMRVRTMDLPVLAEILEKATSQTDGE